MTQNHAATHWNRGRKNNANETKIGCEVKKLKKTHSLKNFPFIIMEEWAYEVAQVIKFLLNISKERFGLVNINHRVYGGKIIYVNRDAC